MVICVINCITGSLGTQHVKVLNLHFGQKRVWLSEKFGTRSWTSRKSQKYTSLVTSQQTVRPLNLSDGQSSEILSFSRSEDASEEIKSSSLTSQPNFKEVEFLLTNLCDTDSIAELELKLDGFHLRVVRDLTEKTKTLPPPTLAPISTNATAEAPKLNGSVSIPTSLAFSKPEPFSVSIQAFLDKAADEGLVIIQSPRMQIVKEGQVVCYIEQLGGQLPIESDVSGEVIKILREDGDPVGYGDTLIAVLPSFPGIKKLQ
ncbi:biotin carboxyl carrier acetyl-CoA carboxylase [Trifolium pratense]|uniref:Biotin carboxyl carrier acetyl-CoA carboxylase n=1 Tax=Trifolium pratense TaxID=57577 RepID=A0A2K3N7C5_TRIPR|nr:biotin carboxyl carrier acetyl-CoA carboxylase [Trifolium pratense]